MGRYTAEDARREGQEDLDDRIKRAVRGAIGNGAYMRVYCDDPWVHRIGEELESRGFRNVRVPDIIICGDVYFEWGEGER